MLNYTPPRGYSLESGYEKLVTKQPFKYSYNHGYVPLTPIHYKKGIKVQKYWTTEVLKGFIIYFYVF